MQWKHFCKDLHFIWELAICYNQKFKSKQWSNISKMMRAKQIIT